MLTWRTSLPLGPYHTIWTQPVISLFTPQPAASYHPSTGVAPFISQRTNFATKGTSKTVTSQIFFPIYRHHSARVLCEGPPGRPLPPRPLPTARVHARRRLSRFVLIQIDRKGGKKKRRRK